MVIKGAVVKSIIGAAAGAKKWLFSDGTFDYKRACILLIGFIVLLLSLIFAGEETTIEAIKLLDDLSDMLGYAE